MWMAGNRPSAGVVREATRLRGRNEAAAGRRRRGACCSGRYNLEVHPQQGPGRTVLVELDQHAAGESVVNYDAAGLAAARVVRPYDSDGGADARPHSAPPI